MNELISEFFYDGIGRVLPGAVVIWLYYHSWLCETFIDYKDFGAYLVIALLGSSWLVGLTIEVFTFIPLATVAYVIKKNVKNQKVADFAGSLIPIRDVIPDKDRRRVYHKFCAEKVLFRAIILTSLICLVKPPELLIENQISPWVIGGCSLLFFFFWFIAWHHGNEIYKCFNAGPETPTISGVIKEKEKHTPPSTSDTPTNGEEI